MVAKKAAPVKKAAPKKKVPKEIIGVAPQVWVVDGERYFDLGEAQAAANS